MGTLKSLFIGLGALSILVFTAPASANPAPAENALVRWRPYVDEASRRFGVPVPWIERVMMAESGGRPEMGGRPTVSHAGAMGLMQLMPGTWSEMRRRLGLGGDPHSPRDNILAGTFYLRLMHDRFGYPGLFAAYNAGPARYVAYLEGRQRLPAETRAYLVKVARGRVEPVGGSETVRATRPGARTGPGIVVPTDDQRLFFIRR